MVVGVDPSFDPSRIKVHPCVLRFDAQMRASGGDNTGGDDTDGVDAGGADTASPFSPAATTTSTATPAPTTTATSSACAPMYNPAATPNALSSQQRERDMRVSREAALAKRALRLQAAATIIATTTNINISL